MAPPSLPLVALAALGLLSMPAPVSSSWTLQMRKLLDYMEGNDDPSVCPAGTSYCKFKPKGKPDGDCANPDFSASWAVSDDGSSITWSASPSVALVVAKGGNGYTYASYASASEDPVGFAMPPNGGGRFAELSHISFCVESGGDIGVEGDPHFVGFDGYRFDLQGEHDTSYNFVSHESVQANIKLVRCGDVFNGREWTPHSNSTNVNKMSTWIGGFGVEHRGDTLRIEKLEDMSIIVEVNGEAVPFNTSVTALGGMEVEYGSKTCDATAKKMYGIPIVTTVRVATELFSFSVSIPHNFARRLDVAVQLHRPIQELEGSVDGLIGATVRAKHPLGASSMEEVYPDTTEVLDDEGNGYFKLSPTLEAEAAAAYTVSGLLAHDDPSNRFDPLAAAGAAGASSDDPPATHRKLIAVSGQVPSTRVVYATASGGSN